jgi:hypothetical protein
MMDRLTVRQALGATAIAWFVASTGLPAWACDVPTPPDTASKPAKLALPQKPACLDKNGKDNCPSWEAYTYADQVKAYNAQLPAFSSAANAYVGKLNAYVAASAAYAKCEAESLR